MPSLDLHKLWGGKVNNKNATERLSPYTIIGYGSADFGLNLLYTGLNLYLLYYYTDVVGIGAGIAGLIFMVSLVWDAATDPLMGYLASRTKTRWGKYRPYLLFTGPFLGLSFVFMFAAPIIWPNASITACFFSHLLFRTVYTVFSVPYSALSASLTKDDKLRTNLSGSRMQFATLGAITTASLTPLLAEYFGDGDTLKGFVYVAVIYALFAEIVFLAVFFSVRETSSTNLPSANFKQTRTVLFSNSAFWILFLTVMCSSISLTIFTKSIVYYARYVLNDASAIREALTLYTIAATCSVLIWTHVGKVISKRFLFTTGLIINISSFLLLFVVTPESKIVFYTLTSCVGLGMTATVVAFWAMLPDTVEYGQWKTGIRNEAIFFGAFQFCQKASSGLAIGLVGVLLSVAEYVPNDTQSESTIQYLRYLSFILPVFFVIIALMILKKYPISNAFYSKITGQSHQ